MAQNKKPGQGPGFGHAFMKKAYPCRAFMRGFFLLIT